MMASSGLSVLGSLHMEKVFFMLQSIVLFQFCSILTSVDCIWRKALSEFFLSSSVFTS